MQSEQLEQELKNLKIELNKLKAKKLELDSAVNLIESYINDIETKLETYNKIQNLSFLDIKNDIFKDS